MLMITCPQCGTINEDDQKNCQKCRVNLYWAFQHYEELTAIRKANQLALRSETSSFLIETSRRTDSGPTASWLYNTIKKWGLKDAGKKVCTIVE
jgi:phage FluMu protein Com